MNRPGRPHALAIPTLVAGLIGVALLLDAGPLHLGFSAPLSPGGLLAAVMAAVGFGLAEVLVMHVEMGRNAHSVSLAELVLAVALFFVPPILLPVARLVGGGSALLVVRRQRPLKLAFNAAVWLLDVALATLVFRALHGSLHGSAWELMLPGVAASVAAAAIDSLAVSAAICISNLEVRLGDSMRFLTACLINAGACSMLGAVSVAALAWSPWLLIPILFIGLAVMAAFRRFGALRQQHTGLRTLYDFTQVLARIPHGESVAEVALDRIVELLLAERAALYLESGDGQWTGVETTRQGSATTRSIACGDMPRCVRESLHSDRITIALPADGDPQADLLRELHARDALVAPITTRRDIRGGLIVMNRLGDVRQFTADDGRLLQTLANLAYTAVSNAELVRRLNHDSTHDSLTGLANRAHFQECLTEAISTGAVTAVLLMDLDRFKEVNDTLGHRHGDLLIRQVSERLQSEIRRPDLLARLGGDEFAVLMQGVGAKEAVATAGRLRRALSSPLELQGVDIAIDASVGIALFAGEQPLIDADDRSAASKVADGAPVTAVSMLQHADVAMYNAKRTGTGVELYRPAQDEHSPRRLALASGLRAAIADAQLTLRYQPLSRVADGAVMGAEALVRWEHPVYGVVAPDDFIQVAEQTGQIRELTRYVLDQAIRDCAWLRNEGWDIGVSVNVSVRNLLEADLVNVVSRTLNRHGVPSRALTIEITESQLMADPARTRQTLEELADLGVRLAVDDFGTGYSSLAYLKQLPVREVKIDKGFIRNLATDASDGAIVEAIVGLAHTLGLEAVAEGVESQDVFDVVAGIGADLAQGYHFARPMPLPALASWLRQHHSVRRAGVLRALPTPRAPMRASGPQRLAGDRLR